ncbi:MULTISPECIES: cation diffusion facilitator family transporter [unclassified Nesterenkonia]|uniref:cation diffusion facilitator family transporter n=1 Tax=unclassified Nesterenkonia TaxID=2629769 RepID=UPI000871B842|nr:MULTISPECIES: cation diffusion facilitator family transporter [unclassified Nesterenkonia]MDS2171226.1 cation diffusion facilitator family transporter [Nesterenkonia sp. CL21]OSM44238.1 cation transporter [Nesterenkonia sp. PF2B19]
MGSHHGHSHAEASTHRGSLAVVCGITGVVVIAQFAGAWLTGSLALLTDAVHSLTDSIGLLVALLAAVLMGRAPTSTRTWGLRRVEVLAAVVQALLLLGIGVYAAVEGVARLSAAPTIPPLELLIFGAVGLVGNVISLLVLRAGRRSSLNMRAAFLEVAADGLGSLGVMVAAVVIALTGWHQADAVAALAIAALILPRAALLLREAVRILLEFTPRGIDLEEVREHMLTQPHVREVHDLHASTVASGLPVITGHVVVDDSCFRDGHAPEILEHLRTCVAEHFPVSLEHSTFQIETAAVAARERHRHR